MKYTEHFTELSHMFSSPMIVISKAFKRSTYKICNENKSKILNFSSDQHIVQIQIKIKIGNLSYHYRSLMLNMLYIEEKNLYNKKR